MQITATQLNQVAAIMGTTDKNAVITVAIGTLVKAGVDIKDAVDAVMGEGAYSKIAATVYHSLRAKQGL